MSWIYFIGTRNNVKIGISKDPNTRLAHLQSANSEKLYLLCKMEGDRADEELLHRFFDSERVELGNEWFVATKRLAFAISFIGYQMAQDMEVSARSVIRKTVEFEKDCWGHFTHLYMGGNDESKII